MVWSGRPVGWRRISSPESIAPTVRLTLRASSRELHLLAALERGLGLLDQAHVERLVEAVVLLLDMAARRPGGTAGRWNTRPKSRPLAFQCAMPFHVEQVGAADQSSNLRMPSCAMIWRASSATKKK